jgi:hypothetical protein
VLGGTADSTNNNEEELFMIQPFSAVRNLVLAFFLISLSACGGGGGGGGQAPGNVFGVNGGQVSGAATPANGGQAVYTFNATANTVYTITTTTLTGDAVLFVWNGQPGTGLASNLIGYSWNTVAATPLNTVSFIANFSGPVSVQVVDGSMSPSGSTFTLEAYTGGLAIGNARTGSTYSDQMFYSFDAVAGTAYQVQLTPQTGNVNIGAVNANGSISVGSSLLAGTAMDTVTFVAPATQRYYVRVDPMSVATNFNLKVVTTTAQPDLRVVVSSAVSDSTNVAVNYTVYNDGLTAAGPFDVALWSDAASAPTIGTVGQVSATIASLAAGASVTGSVVIPNAANAGTAYAVVDTANAIAEKNETNNVSPGKAWWAPLVAPQALNFENSQVPTGMTMSGNAPWVIDAATGSASMVSLKAGTITHSQSSCVVLPVINAASISFDYAVSSESGYDFLKFYIDGVQNGTSKSGTVPWTPSGAISVTSGVHELKWCYSKDWAFSSGSDTAWIDNIVVTSATPDLQVVVTSAVSDGANVTVNYTATNAGTSPAGSFRVDAWSNSATVPAVGATGEGSTTIASLAAGASVTGFLTIANAAASGTAYAIVDTANAIAESNKANNVSPGVVWALPVATYNFEDGLVPAAMTMSGNLPWVNVAGGILGSTRALQAGTITALQTSCEQLAPASSASISFDYSVSSESGFDFLYFYIDGVLTRNWSGLVPWVNSGVIAAGTTGLHTYKWCYSKDGSVNSNLDTAWIDNIVIN